ncbi:uncharacterized protein LOC108602586 isoform X2 [Drosophila busckii]|nr:uncharacterized protein LOC108602586 isoform X2 [Drosophila busckii]
MGDGEKRRDLGSVASLGKARLTGIRFSQVQPRESIQVPNVDVRETLHPFKFRHSEDEDGNTYRRETQLELYLSEHKHIPHDEVDVSSKHPSYTNFKIP